MKKIVIGMGILLPIFLFALDAVQIATWIDSSSVTVRDAVWLVESLGDPTLSEEKISWQKYASLKLEETLTAGKMARILILAGRLKPGLLYRLTHWERYALHAAQGMGIVDKEVVCGMPLTGAEMVAIVGKLP
ncbi:MAG: hypothetical protein N2314_08915 [Brevinematales bacterium]|nr:hypothetical protein [Brevinematales bacterium]